MSNHKQFRQPGEWEPHSACWMAWPAAEDLWRDNLAPAQAEFGAFLRAIHDCGDPLKVLASDAQAAAQVHAALEGRPGAVFEIPYGDIWLRDTAPIFLQGADGARVAAVFRCNGWGGKYVLEHDDQVSERIAQVSRSVIKRSDFILEGGSVESDGEGTCLTSKQCLLNPNRNGVVSQEQVEARLALELGVSKVLWVTEGLVNDHTDGHIDTIARFVAPGEVVCMEPTGREDPNYAVMNQLYEELCTMTDAKGRRLVVHRVPSPGAIVSDDRDIMPASYLNFYIANRGVIVPTYGSVHDSAAVDAIGRLFPGRHVVGLSAYAILSGGGAFHCITQQEIAERESYE